MYRNATKKPFLYDDYRLIKIKQRREIIVKVEMQIWDPYMVLVETQNDTTALENSMDAPPKP